MKNTTSTHTWAGLPAAAWALALLSAVMAAVGFGVITASPLLGLEVAVAILGGAWLSLSMV